MVTGGVASKIYSMEKFVQDVQHRRSGFQMKFKGTSMATHFTWKRVLVNPMALIFLGPPLSSSRNFDSIFRNPRNFDTLHHLYMCYHQHFFGDANACLALLNAYLSWRMDLIEEKYAKDILKVKTCNGTLFQKEHVKTFIKETDTLFETGVESLATAF